MTTDERKEILAELAAAYRGEQRQPGDVDVSDVSEALGCTRHAAAEYMRRLVRAGQYTEHEVRGEKNKPSHVWRKVA